METHFPGHSADFILQYPGDAYWQTSLPSNTMSLTHLPPPRYVQTHFPGHSTVFIPPHKEDAYRQTSLPSNAVSLTYLRPPRYISPPRHSSPSTSVLLQPYTPILSETIHPCNPAVSCSTFRPLITSFYCVAFNAPYLGLSAYVFAGSS